MSMSSSPLNANSLSSNDDVVVSDPSQKPQPNKTTTEFVYGTTARAMTRAGVLSLAGFSPDSNKSKKFFAKDLCSTVGTFVNSFAIFPVAVGNSSLVNKTLA